ncbi:MAG: MopE-related protein, partial [Patescibacteria group bacterium]
LDNDCNGQTDEGFVLIWYLDADHDLFGRVDISLNSCTQPKDYVQNALDCNDFSQTINPNAVELCDDGVDQDCNGKTDDAPTATLWYEDADADGAGNAKVSIYGCNMPTGHVASHDDCDNANPSISPYAQEACMDNIDNNCNGQTDENPVDVTWYQDEDEDGFGTPLVTQLACAPPVGFVGNATDCDDGDEEIRPGVEEVCNNGVDDNCDASLNQCGYSPVLNLNKAQSVFTGQVVDDNSGSFVRNCGDLNGDQIDDLVIGAPGEDTMGSRSGAVYVLFGPLTAGTFSLSGANVKLTGEKVGDEVGSSMTCGDLNGDQMNDLVIGAKGSGPGTTYVLFGPLTAGTFSL